MYGQRHPMPYTRGRGEKLIWNLTAQEALWWGVGLFLSYKMSQIVPPLPLKNIVYRNAHYTLPLLVCLLMAYGKEGKTGMPLFRYIRSYLSFQLRPRTLIYRRKKNDG
ncbi:MAG: hypothetical protein ACYCX4_03545 [Bacillota bacterium]